LSNQTRLLSWLLSNPLSESATMSVITGTACPCMAFGRAGSYSEEWHRKNLSDEDCLSTGIIDPSKTTTSTTFKGIFCPPALVASSVPTGQEILAAIGEIRDDDLLLWGAVNTSTNAIVDFTGTNEYIEYITRDSIKYSIKNAYEIPQICSAAHLRRQA